MSWGLWRTWGPSRSLWPPAALAALPAPLTLPRRLGTCSSCPRRWRGGDGLGAGPVVWIEIDHTEKTQKHGFKSWKQCSQRYRALKMSIRFFLWILVQGVYRWRVRLSLQVGKLVSFPIFSCPEASVCAFRNVLILFWSQYPQGLSLSLAVMDAECMCEWTGECRGAQWHGVYPKTLLFWMGVQCVSHRALSPWAQLPGNLRWPSALESALGHPGGVSFQLWLLFNQVSWLPDVFALAPSGEQWPAVPTWEVDYKHRDKEPRQTPETVPGSF